MADAETKQVHWTKRPENKAKLAKMVKKSVAAKKVKRSHRRKTTSPQSSAHAESIPQDTFAYALGHIECWIEIFSKGAGIPPEALARELGTVLYGKNRR